MRRTLAGFALGSSLIACGGEGPGDHEARDEGAALADVQQPIEMGTNDISNPVRDAVVLLGNGCTGTLIAANVVLTAAHCGFEEREYADGLWNPLSTSMSVYFGPQRSAPIHTATAYQVSTPPFAPTPWPEDIALLRLTANVPAWVATPRPVYIDRPHTLTSSSQIIQVGYGGGRDRRWMTGSNYQDWLTDSSLPTNAFIYTAANRGPGIGDRDTNVEGGDSGGPMLLNSVNGFVMGDLSHWAPYGIATWGPGTGASCPTECVAPHRPSIRNWLNGKAPQRADASMLTIATAGCSGGNPRVRVRVRNSGARNSGFWLDVFHNLPSPPTIGETSTIHAHTATLAPEGWQDLYFTIPAPEGPRWIDVLLDTVGWVSEIDELDNHGEAFLNLPAC